MSEDVRSLMRRADRDLLTEWGAKRSVSWDPPEELARAAWTAAQYVSLALENPDHLAGLAADAERIGELAKPARDWVLRDAVHAYPELEPGVARYTNHESRSLWIWLHHPDAFERAERRLQVFAASESKKLCSRYRCIPAPGYFIADTDLGPFLDAIKAIYQAHDFSGKDLTPNLDWDTVEGVRTAFTLHVAVSRLPSREASFNDEGRLDETSMRRPTNWACRVDLVTGSLSLICDRGGRTVRNESADAVVEHVLQQTEPPVAEEAHAFDLSRLVDKEALPAIDGLTGWRACSIEVRPATREDVSYLVSSAGDAWEDLRALTGAPRGDFGDYLPTSIAMEALFERGTGRTGRSEKKIVVEALAEGNFRGTPKGTRERAVQAALSAFLTDAS